MIGDCVLPFQRKKQVTKQSKPELYPIVKVEQYEFGKVVAHYYVVRKPDGTEVQCKDYDAADRFRHEHS